MNSGHPNPFVRQRPALPWPPPIESDESSRAIPERVWKLADIHGIATAQLANEGSDLLIPVTNDCTSDIQKLELSVGDLAERVLQLNEGHYDKSMWCKRSKRDGVKVRDELLWLPCDAYRIKIRERVATNGWEGDVAYYFKLCLTPAKAVVMLVSVHL